MKNTSEAIDKVETLILNTLSLTDHEILKLTVEKMLSETKNEDVAVGLKRVLATFGETWWAFDKTPYAVSVDYFGKNILSMTTFQYRIAHNSDVLVEIRNIFEKEIFPNVPKEKIIIYVVGKIMMGFDDILGSGVNFKGLKNDDSYYDSHLHDYQYVLDVHREFVRRDCTFIKEILNEFSS